MVFFTFFAFTDHARQVAATGGGRRPQCDKELFVLFLLLLCLFTLFCQLLFNNFSLKYVILYLIYEKGHRLFFNLLYKNFNYFCQIKIEKCLKCLENKSNALCVSLHRNTKYV